MQTKLRLVPKGPWMQTYSGIAVDLVNPVREQILVGDIAHHLSMECRFAGATKFHYSVAQHSYLMMQCARNEGHRDKELLLELLLHDAKEAYCKDLHKPLTWAWELLDPQALMIVKEIEGKFDSLIRSMWQLPQKKSFICNEYDMRALFTERQQLMSNPPGDWHEEGVYRPLDVKIVQWTPTMAEKTWFLAVKELTQSRFGEKK